jgi:hypothetical protein
MHRSAAHIYLLSAFALLLGESSIRPAPCPRETSLGTIGVSTVVAIRQRDFPHALSAFLATNALSEQGNDRNRPSPVRQAFHTCGKHCGQRGKPQPTYCVRGEERWKVSGRYGLEQGFWNRVVVAALWKERRLASYSWKAWGDMKSFYAANAAVGLEFARQVAPASSRDSSRYSHIGARARVAVYESPGAAPRVEDIAPGPVGKFIESFTTRIYELAREQGGAVPYTAIREITENFIHADFSEPVVSVLDEGMTIRFADQGPGISDKDRAVMPGFTTAHGEMKRFIRGVGSGLPIVRDYLSLSGGSLLIEDNLGGGSVVTLFARPTTAGAVPQSLASDQGTQATPTVGAQEGPEIDSFPPGRTPGRPPLSTRQKQVLALVMESGSAGPSLVANELGCGVSTAYRDLAALEDLGLICSDGGKRTLTERGLACFDHLVNR